MKRNVPENVPSSNGLSFQQRVVSAVISGMIIGTVKATATGIASLVREKRDRRRAEDQRLGKLQLVEAMVAAKFGSVSPEVKQRLQLLPADRLQQLALAIPSVESVAELGL